MFSSEQVGQLKDSLEDFDFTTAVSTDGPVQAYKAHYGLSFDDLPVKISHCLGKISSDEFQIACQYFAPPETDRLGTALVIHGYYDHVGLYGHLIKHCLSTGLAVMTFDLPGHGLSTGASASIDSFDQYSAALTRCLELVQPQLLGKPLHLIAQSTGAATVINCLIRGQCFAEQPIEKIVLLAPLLRPVNWRRGKRLFYILRRFVNKTKRDFSPNSHDKEFSKFIIESDPLQCRFLPVDWVNALVQYLKLFESAPGCEVPLAIIQGTADKTVDWQYNLPKLAEKFPNSTSHLINGAQHHLVNETSAIRTEVFATLLRILDEKN